jgi:DNA-binding NarL/FixJ family response regulator
LTEIRIVLLSLRGLLHDLIKAVLAGSPDLSVVAECSDPADLPALIARSGAEVVVCDLDESTALDVGTRLFEPHLRVKVIAVQDDGQRAVLWELRPQRRELGDLSVPGFVEAVRRVTRP